ncbi:MAG TPA: alpha/beta fold hydrolase [Spirochaetales bacterium]|nr:alpha/beta fold hydrolase [Spirochaetales bacterium]
MNSTDLPGHGPSTIPIFMRRPGASDAVLLVHGYTGFPGEMGYVAEALFRAGHTVYAPRLPGHGTDRADFMATGALDWVRRARDAYIELAAEYGRVRLVGHSMGGAIAVILAADYAPDRVALLTPAVDIADRRLALAASLGRLVPVIKRDDPPSPEDAEGERRRLHEEYRKDTLVRQAGELNRVMRLARAALPRVRSRLLVVSGELDASVPASAAARIASTSRLSPEIRLETLKGVGHLFPFLPDGRHDCARLVEEWFEE